MKDLNPKETAEIGGGLEPRQYDMQVAPEPACDPNIIDYNPEHPPQ
jgi:hypothetical protein